MAAQVSRRQFIGTGIGLLAAGSTSLAHSSDASKPALQLAKSPFRIAVITDEISQDFGHACEVASRKFGMAWVEVRGLWNKNIANLDAKETAEAMATLKKYGLRVTDIASPLFKTDFSGAPKSKFA